MIDVVEVTKEYGDRSALRAVNLALPRAQLSYLLGRNGAGKSTLLRCLSGLTTPSTGTVLLDGRPIGDRADRARLVGIHLGGKRFPPGHTARRYLRFRAAAAGVGRSRVNAVLDDVGMTDHADRPLSGFSLGMAQRIGIAAALLPDPAALIFDEPHNGLDIVGIHWVRALLTDLAAGGRTVVVASHLLDEVARTADRVIMLDDGAVVADEPLSDFVGAATDLEEAYLIRTGRRIA
ncbi:ATP-binding cassette domain-containing protein [Gordonia sp. TBRC 11910]|uniref:ATP-binding cassette domain-containing protein n=1 Tax=Gordonia asplenii TaxID=2725283 RepID=A0A848KS09_9ACTN|nr:ATP-binding cassette domain-containing protein [Gordonia asplenii]